ncbi:endonuclease/exonuclease/phosphatase family protein [Streptomyces sp. NBC_00439]|uniref:endonuclease/exonuclease/phosphatase family protein n=2 Tax=unclassified Streptomyces TaxID=2593676 RepID=UPI002255A38C|nr:endonuclease/exonuclease/phosphatase family protein [Streptomyces sp. NBC_00439]MCX5103622.1 endonuclease/exonuclease/phosphatase family protein [Streptomyces sp. NBC_00439]WSX07228.1 endonuclease/exonuclease/phosphatase family protein [Streptomyces sp. NBC_00987]
MLLTDLLPKPKGTLRICTYNLLNGGLDGWTDGLTSTRGLSTTRWRGQMELLRKLDLDVLAVQEAKLYNSGGMAEATGKALEMDWELAPSGSHGCHLVTFVRRGRVSFRGFVPDAAEGKFHHTLSRASLVSEESGWRFDLFNTHLAPFNPDDRSSEVGWVTEFGTADDVIIAGDLNGMWPGDAEPENWDWLPVNLHSRHRRINPDGTYGPSNRDAQAKLRHAGFSDPVTSLGYPWGATVGHWSASENYPMRFDHILPSAGCSGRLRGWKIIRTPNVCRLSDHLPVVADFSLST